MPVGTTTPPSQLPAGLVPQDPGQVNQFAGPVGAQQQKYRQQLGGNLPPLGTPPTPTPAPPITAAPVYSDQDLQNQVNQQRAFAAKSLATQQKQMADTASQHGFGAYSPGVQQLQQNAASQSLANELSNEQNLRFGVRQANASQLLAGQQAQSQQWNQANQLAQGAYGLGLQGYGVGAQQDLERQQLAAQMATTEGGWQQQVGMQNLQQGGQVYQQNQALTAQLNMLTQQLGFQGAQNEMNRQLQTALQQGQITSQQYMQAQDLAQQWARQQSAQGSAASLQAGQIAGQFGLQGQQQAFQGAQNTQQQGATAALQTQQLNSQMQQLQAQIQAAAVQGQDTRALQAQMAQLQAQSQILQTGMQGQNALNTTALTQQGQLLGQQLSNQQQQWSQAFGTQAGFEQQMAANQQAEFMARLQASLGQSNWLQQQEVGFNQQRALAPVQNWLTQQQIRGQGAMNNVLQQNQFAMNAPLQMWQTAQQQATQRMPYDPRVMASQNANAMILQSMNAINANYQNGVYVDANGNPDPSGYYQDITNAILAIRGLYGAG